MTMTWSIRAGHGPDALGFIPSFIDENDPRPAKEQIDANYQHGGGWHSFVGHDFNKDTLTLTYPGDPPLRPIAFVQLRDELIIVYPYSWVLIMQRDGTWDVARID